jgi:hypothetical protein
MHVGKEIEEDFRVLVEKTIKANLLLLSETKEIHYSQRLMLVNEVTNNLETISKSINS